MHMLVELKGHPYAASAFLGEMGRSLAPGWLIHSARWVPGPIYRYSPYL